jgi:hypothetical protein
MARSIPTRDTRSDRTAPKLSGTPSETPSPKRTPEQPVGGARLSKDCGVHSSETLPPLRR